MEGRVDLPGRPGAWVREVRPQGGQGPEWGTWALREARGLGGGGGPSGRPGVWAGGGLLSSQGAPVQGPDHPEPLRGAGAQSHPPTQGLRLPLGRADSKSFRLSRPHMVSVTSIL